MGSEEPRQPEAAEEQVVVEAEVVEEPTASAPGAPADPGATVDEDLAALLSSTEAERDSYLQLAQRTQADFENYRKRMTAEVSAAGERAKADLAGSLISVLDNLEHALVAAGVDPRAALDGDVTTDGDLEKGVVLTYRELVTALARAGVQPDDPTGVPFDPTWHEALQARAHDLSRRYLGAAAVPESVRWVTNQQARWGSCTPAKASIRVSHRLRGAPGWVLDYVLIHELAHLLVATHDEHFWRLVAGYPQAERAKGFLEGVVAAEHLDLTGLSGSADVD